ncbi:DUF5994 family protein [Streptomyces sp. SID3343]|uniref:DUF5994 family protein n=1 Tax=Streptomyces sp. SID3343 TaxID=2690260 RepID=UPI00136D3162|nr:DUF5994 family protein [Streptomyces sp. SID3343]MYV97867.1 hypothetical protein [Streptomyces sp. SID3343]
MISAIRSTHQPPEWRRSSALATELAALRREFDRRGRVTCAILDPTTRWASVSRRVTVDRRIVRAGCSYTPEQGAAAVVLVPRSRADPEHVLVVSPEFAPDSDLDPATAELLTADNPGTREPARRERCRRQRRILGRPSTRDTTQHTTAQPQYERITPHAPRTTT